MNSINRNLMAMNVVNNLNSHYGRLATSVERLSSGLRINSSADDAAGLAIRELMRAGVAALNQGIRNANDAISMIQVADGALGVIDEKLIRMKELAEQAATGTYDSTQRLMIHSEFMAMGDEIDRIARATDFNGIKILDGSGIVKPDNPGTPIKYDVEITEAFDSQGGILPRWAMATIKPGLANPGALGTGESVIRLTHIAGTDNFTSNRGTVSTSRTAGDLDIVIDLGNNNKINQRFQFGAGATVDDMTWIEYTLTITDPNAKPVDPDAASQIPSDVVKIHFGPGNDKAEDYYYIQKNDCTREGLGIADLGIATQEKAQEALVGINDAITSKDKVRAYLGAMHNRLENTIANLSIQSENLRASESRISDADVATEMMIFVRNQVLTQASMAMLGQANSYPQMLSRLING